jgi:phosphate:Na+ symporter
MHVIWDILQVVGSLGIFIYGMKIMSEGLQKVAGDRLRQILRGMTTNRFTGVLTGTLVTFLIQSSSATTVMVVSFVNAGLLTLSESLGVIMGANIGTTITAWMVTIFGFKVKITPIAIALIGVSFPFLFSNKERLKHAAEFIVGFGILFIGLEFLKDSVPDLKENPEALEFITSFTDKGFLSTIIFVLVGTVLTIVVQSSSASSTITLIMVDKGWIPFELGAAMILGENIGTTITANIAAIIANVHAKRAARFHFLFNVIGVCWILVAMPFFLDIVQSSIGRVLDFVSTTFNKPDIYEDEGLLSLALFHTMFNVTNVLLLVGFVPYLSNLVIKMVPSKGDEDEDFKLQYIQTGLMDTAQISIENAKKELKTFAKLIDQMFHNTYALLFEEQKNPSRLIDKIKRREDLTDTMEIELNEYLSKVSESGLTQDAYEEVAMILTAADELERIADIYYEITLDYERMRKKEIKMPEEARAELKELMLMVKNAIKLMRLNLDESDDHKISLEEAEELENEIDKRTRKIIKSHYKRLEKGVYTTRAGVLFLDFINRAERIADHVFSVNRALHKLR